VKRKDVEICDFVELFCGIGGFRLGLEETNNFSQAETKRVWKEDKKEIREGRDGCEEKGHSRLDVSRTVGEQHGNSGRYKQFNCVWANDFDKYACQIYRKNFGDKELVEADISTVNVNSIPKHQLLTAGFPCQAFSIAGKRKGFQDTRGTLFYHIIRVAEAKRPKLLLLENVKGLLSHDKGLTFQVIIESLDELGYLVEWQVLNSKYFGVPQNRERVFIVGHLRGTSTKQIFPIGENHPLDVRETIKINPFHKSGSEIKRIYNVNGIAPTLHRKTGGWQEPKIANALVSTYYKGPAQRGDRTMIPVGDMKIRRLLPLECERLQGFPNNWTKGVSDTQRYKLLGNAVTVSVIKFLGEQLSRI